MIGEIDQDGNGCISFNEFLYLMTKSVHEDGDIEEEIREAFRVFDREGHGFITVPDLSQVLTTLGDKLTEGKQQSKSLFHRVMTIVYKSGNELQFGDLRKSHSTYPEIQAL